MDKQGETLGEMNEMVTAIFESNKGAKASARMRRKLQEKDQMLKESERGRKEALKEEQFSQMRALWAQERGEFRKSAADIQPSGLTETTAKDNQSEQMMMFQKKMLELEADTNRTVDNQGGGIETKHCNREICRWREET